MIVGAADVGVCERIGTDVVTKAVRPRGYSRVVGTFVRRVKTASGATAVQIVHKRGRRVLSIEHIGSAHTDDELALLLQIAEERLHDGQLTLDLNGAGAVAGGRRRWSRVRRR